MIAGYAGEVVTRRRAPFTFAPDRGTSKSILGRVSRTLHFTGSLAFEVAVRQNGDGAYGKLEYSRPHGAHWRSTVTVIGLGGQRGDFLGQYARNSHVALSLRYSY